MINLFIQIKNIENNRRGKMSILLNCIEFRNILMRIYDYKNGLYVLRKNMLFQTRLFFLISNKFFRFFLKYFPSNKVPSAVFWTLPDKNQKLAFAIQKNLPNQEKTHLNGVWFTLIKRILPHTLALLKLYYKRWISDLLTFFVGGYSLGGLCTQNQ